MQNVRIVIPGPPEAAPLPPAPELRQPDRLALGSFAAAGRPGPRGPAGSDAVIWYCAVGPSGTVFAREDLTGPGNAEPGAGQMIVCGYDGFAYFIVSADPEVVHVAGHKVDLKGPRGEAGPPASGYASSRTTAGPADKAVSIPFAQVDSTSTSTEFTARAEGITELRDGVCVYLKNGVVTSASGWTLNVNGLGAKPVYGTLAEATRSTTVFNVNYTMLFVYNSTRVEGGCWDIFYGYNSDNNTLAYNVRWGSGRPVTQTALYRYQLLFTMSEDRLLPVNSKSNVTGTGKPLTTLSFDPFGPIFYYASTTAVSAAGAVNTNYLYTQYASVDLRYSWNCGQTLTSQRSLYVVCVPQSDGKVKLHTAPLTQTLPDTEDGLVYLYLGECYSSYQLMLHPVHPAYCFRGGRLQLWTGVQPELDALAARVAALEQQ